MARKRARHKGITPPELPPESTLQPAGAARLADGAHFSQALLSGCDLSGQAGNDVLFDHAVLRRALLSGTRLRQSQCLDVRVETCELVNADWEKIALQRTEWLNSRLGGLRLPEARIDDAVFEGCQLDFAIFWGARLRRVRFENCRLTEASFEGATLEEVVFRNCDLSRADLQRVALKQVDLRGSQIQGMQIGARELAGAIVEPQQAIALATLLGITVKSLEEDDSDEGR